MLQLIFSRLAIDENGRVFDALNFRCNIIKVIFT